MHHIHRLIAERYAPTRGGSSGIVIARNSTTQNSSSGNDNGDSSIRSSRSSLNGSSATAAVINTDVVRAIGARRRQFVAFQSIDVLAAVLKACRLLGR